MKRLTKDQEENRDIETDWFLAQVIFSAQAQNVWRDYSPTTNWLEGGSLIEKYRIDVRYFSKELNQNLEYEWLGGLQLVDKKTKLLNYYTAFSDTPLKAAMKALAVALSQNTF